MSPAVTVAMINTAPRLPAIAPIAPADRPPPLPTSCKVEVDVDCGRLLEEAGKASEELGVVGMELEEDVTEVMEVGNVEIVYVVSSNREMETDWNNGRGKTDTANSKSAKT